jgi:CRISPR system Cascade subunit CasA
MNASTDPWIPVVWEDGRTGLVSLQGVFEFGEKIRDLAVRPHERIAVMRLLICITQAALDGPADSDDWKTCFSEIIPAALYYLKQWNKAFELLGNGPRFLQCKGDGQPGTMKLDKLGFVDADMTTLFDQDVESGRKHSYEWIIFNLVVYQSFAAGGTVGGAIEINGRLQSQKGKNGPCRDSSAFHAFIRRSNLIATIYSNLVTKENILNWKSVVWGFPVWEVEAISLAGFQFKNITTSYLGRLVPLSRAVWLNDDGVKASNANGLLYPGYSDGGVRETTTSVKVVKDKDGQLRRILLSARKGESIKSPWRELYALTVNRISKDGAGGPLVLGNLNDNNNESFDFWIGAVVTEQATIDDTVESTYSVPAGMLKAETQLAYEKGVQYAEHFKVRLNGAISTYRLAMETNETTNTGIDLRLKKMNRSDKERLAAIGGKAFSNYWTLIEYQLELLNCFALEIVSRCDDNILNHESDWFKYVRHVAKDSYENSCPHGTPRQMRAYALGLNKLYFMSDALPNMPDIHKEVES